MRVLKDLRPAALAAAPWTAAILTLAAGVWYFRKTERQFADVI